MEPPIMTLGPAAQVLLILIQLAHIKPLTFLCLAKYRHKRTDFIHALVKRTSSMRRAK